MLHGWNTILGIPSMGPYYSHSATVIFTKNGGEIWELSTQKGNWQISIKEEIVHNPG